MEKNNTKFSEDPRFLLPLGIIKPILKEVYFIIFGISLFLLFPVMVLFWTLLVLSDFLWKKVTGKEGVIFTFLFPDLPDLEDPYR